MKATVVCAAIAWCVFTLLCASLFGARQDDVIVVVHASNGCPPGQVVGQNCHVRFAE